MTTVTITTEQFQEYQTLKQLYNSLRELVNQPARVAPVKGAKAPVPVKRTKRQAVDHYKDRLSKTRKNIN